MFEEYSIFPCIWWLYLYHGKQIILSKLNFISIVAGEALEDQCSKKPCQNGGECIQARFGRYKCDCQGTKHFGEHCEKGNTTRLNSILLIFKII